jgi:methyl-accepting chemotaxis protein
VTLKLTIRNKLVIGFYGVLALMAGVAAIGIFALFSLRESAREATNVGGRLNAVALEIQVHNLEAQRRVKSYLEEVGTIGPQQAREQYLDEAEFEIHEMKTLAERAVALAPTPEKRAKFEKLTASLKDYETTRLAAVAASGPGGGQARATAAAAAYGESAEHLHENAEDGEVAGREAAESSQEDIERTSLRAVRGTIIVSILGLLLGSIMSFTLARAILVPVEHLKNVAENVSMGNLDISVGRHSDDEIGDLAESFSRMLIAVKFFRMEAEMAQQEPQADDLLVAAAGQP